MYSLEDFYIFQRGHKWPKRLEKGMAKRAYDILQYFYRIIYSTLNTVFFMTWWPGGHIKKSESSGHTRSGGGRHLMSLQSFLKNKKI
jgi:uncharacterized sporulation protein YeaH/YhbH (DUF444 family)